MSRSKRKTSIHGITTAESEKADKLAAHRKYRRTLKQKLEAGLDTPLPVERELSNVWSFAKDGKRYLDPRKYAWLMRK